jgi:putative transposase
MRLSDLVKEIKVESNQFINSKPWSNRQFAWQSGYGAFTYSQSHVDRVVNYIRNQEAHHKSRTFSQEYTELLRKFKIPYDERYLFDFGS